jgi:uncharacterized repeat protein (TIGR01451 family)
MIDNMKSLFPICAVLTTSLLCLTAEAKADTFAAYSSATTGDLNGTAFTLTGFRGGFLHEHDLSGGDFQGAAGPGPGSALQPIVDFSVKSSWSISLSAPVPVLYVYVVFWRGNSANAPTDDPAPNVEYTLDHPFTIVSGMTNVTVSDNIISAPQIGFHSGILKFTNISSLALGTNATGDSFQAVTFRVAEAAADLHLTKSASSTNVVSGDTFQYLIGATNNGPADASQVVVTDSLPPEVSLLSCSAPGGTCHASSNNLTIAYDTLAAGATATVTLTVTLAAGAADGATITNTASITSNTADSNPANNTAAVSITAHVPHTLTFFLHGNDVARIAGKFVMNPSPAPAVPLVIDLLNAISWLGDPPLAGSFRPDAQFSVTIPCTVGLGVGVSFQLASTDPQGGYEQVIGQTTQLLALCTGVRTISLTPSGPVSLTNRRLKLTISALVAAKLTLHLGTSTFVQATKFVGSP